MTAARADGNFLFAHLKVIAGRMPAQKPIATAAAAVASLSGVVDPPQRHDVAGEVIHAASSRLGAGLKTVDTSVCVSRGGTVKWSRPSPTHMEFVRYRFMVSQTTIP